jgi:geranyl-CoA carboxylase alpha subunit
MRSFRSVLVANRGEIAVRILKSVRAAGYRSIAVYSEADAHAPHVRLADEAVLLGPAPVKDSYLAMERVLDAAQRSGAEAIHPGYGFLSENAEFAAACEAAGIVFIGPSVRAIELMGNKAAAKRLMLEAGVPCIPGFQQANADDATLLAASREIGLPLMVKAAAGGGGRGMRLVADFDALPGALEAARSEARNAFGSDELILEKAVQAPRHVEVQVFGDHSGHIIHLGERDCSVQRRHQKVVEEAPCPVMTPQLRSAMGEAAVAAARSIDYVGAGTVEFLLDADGHFYFLEMNTRLQVEHPVTECITGLDLVDLQLRVAGGAPLGIRQEEVQLCGHAIEVRLYAEDVHNDFLPAAGRVERWLAPCGEGLRVDHGLCDGLEISPFYDPMLAKIVASGPDRETARRRLLRGLEETVLFGVTTNREFLIDVLARQRFAAGEATTAFLDEEYPQGVSCADSTVQERALAAALQMRRLAATAASRRVSGPAAFLSMRRLPASFLYSVGDSEELLQVLQAEPDHFEVSSEQGVVEVVVLSEERPGLLRVAVDGIQYTVHVGYVGASEIQLQWRGRSFRFQNRLDADRGAGEGADSGAVLAPMHGNLLSLRVAVGDRVERGDEVAVIEAMKMEHRLTASGAGAVVAIHGREGDQVAAGAVVIEIAAGIEGEE